MSVVSATFSSPLEVTSTATVTLALTQTALENLDDTLTEEHPADDTKLRLKPDVFRNMLFIFEVERDHPIR